MGGAGAAVAIRQRWAERPARVLARSERLVLTRLRRSDAAAVADSIDDEVRHWQGWAAGDDEREVDRVQRGRFNLYMGKPADLAVREPATNRYLGSYRASWTGLDLHTTEVELGWWLHPTARGRGLGSESLRLVVRYFAERTPVATIRVRTRHDHERARAQLRGVGAELVEERPITLPDGSSPPGSWFVIRLPR